MSKKNRKEKKRIYAIKNAVEHNGKAVSGADLNSLFAAWIV